MAAGFNLRAVYSVVDRGTKQMRSQLKWVRSMKREYGQLRRSLRNFADVSGITMMSRGLRRAVGLAGQLAAKLKLAVGLGAAAGGALLVRWVQSFAAEGDLAAKAAQRLGYNVRTLQADKYAAARSGVDETVFANGMRTLNLQVARAARGDENLKGLFNQMGVNIRDANGELRSAGDLLPEVAEAFKKNTNATLRNAMAAQLFETEGVNMITMLAGGAEGLMGFRREAERLGGVMGERLLALAEDYSDAMTDNGEAIKGVRNAIMGELLPVVTPMIRAFTEWVVVNKEIIATKVSDFILEVVAAARSFDWAGLVADVRGFLGSVNSTVEAIGGWKTALIGLVVVMNAGALVAMGQLVSSMALFVVGAGQLALVVGGTLVAGIGQLIGYLVLLAPYVAGAIAATWSWTAAFLMFPGTWVVLALIAAFVALVYYWDDVVEAFSDGWDWVASTFESGWQKIKPIIDALQQGWSYLTGGGDISASQTQTVNHLSSLPSDLTSRSQASAAQQSQLHARVSFDNLPPGASVSVESSGVDPEVEVGRAQPPGF